MENDHKDNGDKFRESTAACKNTYIFQAVYDKQSEHCGGQYPAQILNILGVGRPAGNMRNGRKRVSIVARITIATVMICCEIVMAVHRLSLFLS